MSTEPGWQGTFFDLPKELSDPERARVIIIPAPFEASVSYGKGASAGPFAIFEASKQVELFEPELGSVPAEAGISSLPALKLENLKPEQAAKAVEATVKKIFEQGRRPVMLGGEHSLTIGAVRAAQEFHKDIVVLHLDAHADLRDQYLGDAFSHACVMRRVYDLGVKFISAGIRNISSPERAFFKEKKLNIYFMHRLAQVSGWEEMIARELGEKIYITLDLDVLDPSVMPGVGTPEPGGMSYSGLLKFLRTIAKSGKEVVGFDLVELAPIPGQLASEFTAARLLYQMIGLFWAK